KPAWAANVNFTTNGSPSADRAFDWNGDGLPDILVSGSALINQNKKADLLTRIYFPAGGFSAITYKPSPQYASSTGGSLNPHLPLIIYTTQKIESNDGTATSSSDTYSYKDGAYYFNNAFDRKFAG